MTVFIILILTPLVLWLLRPLIRKWIYRTLERKTEEMLRRAAGMPPRDKKQRSNDDYAEGNNSYGSGYRTSSHHAGYERYDDGPKIPREYAEDVEFTEYRDYSSDTSIRTSDTGEESIVIEKQVTDVQWEEIKDK